MTRIRVLVAEDSITMRRIMVAALSGDPEIDVVGETSDGSQAARMCQDLRPDVLTLDMVLPGLDGEAVTEYIMAHCPTPILIVSGSFNRGEVFKTYDALAAGALDVLEKPTGLEPLGGWERNLLHMVKMLSRIKVITHVRGRLRPTRLPCVLRADLLNTPAPTNGRVLLLGTSTGGPAALSTILKALGPDFPLPILAVIHIGEAFGKDFVTWLDGQSPLRVTHACAGEPLAHAAGRVLLAPPDHHMEVVQDRMLLNRNAPLHSCRPSVDVLFSSAARNLGPRAIACLLTGMGRDGAQGLLEIRKAGGLTVAQDEGSSVVFGMPREAVALGAAERVLPLEHIGSFLQRYCAEKQDSQ